MSKDTKYMVVSICFCTLRNGIFISYTDAVSCKVGIPGIFTGCKHVQMREAIPHRLHACYDLTRIILHIPIAFFNFISFHVFCNRVIDDFQKYFTSQLPLIIKFNIDNKLGNILSYLLKIVRRRSTL